MYAWKKRKLRRLDKRSTMRALGRQASWSLMCACAFLLAAPPAPAADWSVPLAGNAFRSQPQAGRGGVGQQGLRWNKAKEVYSVFFHVDRPGEISLALEGRAELADMRVEAQVNSEQFKALLQAEAPRAYPLGSVQIAHAGYVRVDLRCNAPSSAAAMAEVSQLLVASSVDGLVLDFVKSNEGNMFYWGRRGPSVHLAYQTPPNTELTYAYSEITVPEGQDQKGAYFMANGFGEGYFGFQVNSDTERRVLFSVWSPFRTDNPSEIPAEDRVVTLAKGDGVHAQDFGNEGSGGQSYWIYPWKAGVTYRFLTEVKPDGQGNTQYTSWFGQKQSDGKHVDQWQLIASFRRPKTDRHLSGFHAFLENFIPEFGHLERLAEYGNQWVCDVDGQWHEVTRAKLTGDNTARGRSRLDYAGGADADHFFLRHCGFFDETTPLDQIFERDASPADRPEIVFEDLPRQ